MSQKWIRSKKWDDEHLTGALLPVKVVLRVLSSIPFAVVLLFGVSMYGTLASVPIGLLALAPTYLIYAATLLIAVLLVAVLPVRVFSQALAAKGAGRAARFVAAFVGFISLTLLAIWLWRTLAWPALRYDSIKGTGFRLFADFVNENKAITVRRLPGMEMSELEFYAWWPLKVILALFILNMITATLRRIEFIFPNIGVLTVHSGIVTLALGSMYYSSLKEEGDMILLAGAADSEGKPTPGPPERGFYDNTKVALWVSNGTSWQQRPLTGVPRYRDYNLNALGLPGLDEWATTLDGGRKLELPVPAPGPDSNSVIPSDVSFRVVGYSPFANQGPWWMASSPGEIAELKTPAHPVRNFEMVMRTGSSDSLRVSERFQVFPSIPAARIHQMGMGITLEYTRSMSESRWNDLLTETPPGSLHSLVIDVPATDSTPAFHSVIPLTEPDPNAPSAPTPLGQTGYTIETVRLLPSLLALLADSQTFPIGIQDPLYTGADTSTAVIKINPPASKGAPYLRFVHHRFPEQTEDVVATRDTATGKPGPLSRRTPDPAIRLGYIDASAPQYYIDETAADESPSNNNPSLRGVFRPRAGQAQQLKDLGPGSVITLGPMAGVRVAERWLHAKSVEYPVPTPEQQRDNKELGTHKYASLAVEVRRGDWKEVVWLPFAQYALTEKQMAKTIHLPGPDSAPIMLIFGRVMRTLPTLEIQLADFNMKSHDFGGPTQDFRSDLVVTTGAGDKRALEMRYTSLNDPLLVKVPFHPREDAFAAANFLGKVVSMVAPTQYKFSQAGWDPEGWNSTQAEVEHGLRPRPMARWTILGVGNNPGIYVIATGAILMVVGIPWAFYVKPLIMKARKKKIQRELLAQKAAAEKTESAQSIPESESAGAQA